MIDLRSWNSYHDQEVVISANPVIVITRASSWPKLKKKIKLKTKIFQIFEEIIIFTKSPKFYFSNLGVKIKS